MTALTAVAFADSLDARHAALAALERMDLVVARGQMMRLDADEAHRRFAGRTRPRFAPAVARAQSELYGCLHRLSFHAWRQAQLSPFRSVPQWVNRKNTLITMS